MFSIPLLDRSSGKLTFILLSLVFCLPNCQNDETVKKDLPKQEIVFFQAIDQGDYEKVQKILNEGFPINKKDTYGNSALIRAVDQEEINIVQLLIDKGANPNLRNTVGETALYRAVFRGNFSLVKFLVEKGAETKIKNIEGVSPVQLADDRGEDAIQKYLESLNK